MRRNTGLALLVITLFAVVGCSDVEPTQPETTTTTALATTSTVATTASTAATTSEPPPEASLSIRMAAFAFSGDETGNVGDTVRVVNNDDFSHTWTSTDQEFHSGTLGPGEEFFHTFDQPGTFGYFCQIHPEMGGTITIEG